MTTRHEIDEQERLIRYEDELVTARKKGLRERKIFHTLGLLYRRYNSFQQRHGIVGTHFIEWLHTMGTLSHTWERDRDGVGEETRLKRAAATLAPLTRSEYTLLGEEGAGQLSWFEDGLEALINERYSLRDWRIKVQLLHNGVFIPRDLHFELVGNDDSDTEQDRIDEAAEDTYDEQDEPGLRL